MNAPAKLAGFSAALAVLFGGGTLAGAALGPDREDEPAPAMAGHGDAAEPAATAETGGHGGDDAGAHGGEGAADAVRGLAVSDGRLRLDLITDELPRGERARLRFAVRDRDGRVVRDFDVEHTKRMHVIVVRRDLDGFQHLHPRRRADGTWSTPIRIDDAGSYRVFADFSHEGRASTLATDVRVDGPADLQELPAPAPAAVSDGGYEVRLDAGRVRAGREAELRFTVLRDGHPVHVEPYLGAGGHLVALREGDLAFLHVHPTEHGHGDEGADEGAHDDSVGFGATFPTEGRYRLFLQFKHEGRVHTAAFTQEVTR